MSVCSLCKATSCTLRFPSPCTHSFCSSHTSSILFALELDLINSCPLCTADPSTINNAISSITQKLDSLHLSIQALRNDLSSNELLALKYSSLLEVLTNLSTSTKSLTSPLASTHSFSQLLTLQHHENILCNMDKLSEEDFVAFEQFLLTLVSKDLFFKYLFAMIKMFPEKNSIISLLIPFSSSNIDHVINSDDDVICQLSRSLSSYIIPQVLSIIDSSAENKRNECLTDSTFFISIFITCLNSQSSKQAKSRYRAILFPSLITKDFSQMVFKILSLEPSQEFLPIFKNCFNTLYPCTVYEKFGKFFANFDLISRLLSLLAQFSDSNSFALSFTLTLVEPLTIALGYLTRIDTVKRMLPSIEPSNGFTLLVETLSRLEKERTGDLTPKVTSCIAKIAGILWNGSSDTKNREFIGKLGLDIITTLVSTLTKFSTHDLKSPENDVVIENVVGFLWNIVVLPENKLLMLKSNVIPLLVQFFQHKKLNILKNSTGCLWVLSSDGQVRDYIQRELSGVFLQNCFNIFSYIFNNSKSQLGDVTEHVAGILRNCVLNDGFKRDLIKFPNGLLTLFKVLDMGSSPSISPNLLDKVLSVLWIISGISESSSVFGTIDQQLIEVLISYTHPQQDPNINEKVLGILRNITSYSDVRPVFSNTSLIKICLLFLSSCTHADETSHDVLQSEMIASNDSSPCDFACVILANLARDASFRTKLIESDLINHLISHLTSTVVSCSLAENVLIAIQSILIAEDESFNVVIDEPLLNLLYSCLFSVLSYPDTPRFVTENALAAILSSLKYSSRTHKGLRIRNLELFLKLLFDSEANNLDPFTTFLLQSQHEHVVRDVCRLLNILLNLDDDITRRICTRDVLFELVQLSGCDSQVIRKASASCLAAVARVPELKEKLKEIALDQSSCN
ncbi:hypothetical protein P9112_012091 [Eukaryota sp. TZLM1-RC]